MAALLVTRFPEKGPELWAYQTTNLRAAHNYEGASWVAYNRQFRRDMLAQKDLNWSTPNARLYNEAFTGRAKIIPRCLHCVSEDHTTAVCPHNPNPAYVGWFPNPYLTHPHSLQSPTPPALLAPAVGTAGRPEVCRNFNENHCRFTRCQYAHVCSECSAPHPAISCPVGPHSQQQGHRAATARPNVSAKPKQRPHTPQPASDTYRWLLGPEHLSSDQNPLL